VLCSLVGGYQCFGGIYHLHLQGRSEWSLNVGQLYCGRALSGNGEKEEWRKGSEPEDSKFQGRSVIRGSNTVDTEMHCQKFMWLCCMVFEAHPSLPLLTLWPSIVWRTKGKEWKYDAVSSKIKKRVATQTGGFSGPVFIWKSSFILAFLLTFMPDLEELHSVYDQSSEWVNVEILPLWWQVVSYISCISMCMWVISFQEH
jgi:hypothetical protein